MGTNIKAHIEVQKDGVWYHYAAPHVLRDYTLFAAICGERINPDWPVQPRPVSTHHEFPADMSFVTRRCLEVDKYGRNPGWLTADELVKLQDELYRVNPEIKRTGIDPLDLEESILRTYIAGNSIARHDGWDDVRLVYWFD